MGPLGHGFEIKDSVKNAVIIGGGIGVFPLYKLAKNINADVFLGFRSKDRVVMEDEFSDVSNMVIVGTDDGSYGYNGYIASAMEQYLDSHKCDMIYSCGPMPMLKAVKKIAENRGIKCQVSLEQRMAAVSVLALYAAVKRIKRVRTDMQRFVQTVLFSILRR